MTEDFSHLKEVYYEECAELLESAESVLLKFEKGQYDLEDVHVIFRAIHSIKGGAGAFGEEKLVHYVHIFESVLGLLRDGILTLEDIKLDLLFQATDQLRDMIHASREGKPYDLTQQEKILKDLEALTAEKLCTVSPQKDNNDFIEDEGPWRVIFWPPENMLAFGGEPLFMVMEILKLGGHVKSIKIDKCPTMKELDLQQNFLGWEFVLPKGVSRDQIDEVFEFVADISELEIENLGAANSVNTTARDTQLDQIVNEAVKDPLINDEAADEEVAKHQNDAIQFVRIDLKKIDEMVNLVGELVINQSMLQQQVTQLDERKARGLLKGLENFTRLTRSLQEAAMTMRALPVNKIFNRLPRLVRDISRELNKEVQLDIIGGDTEVDRSIIEHLIDPITHMLRNSLDHGIETPEEREQSGKERIGNITIVAEHRGGRILISVADDGRGIDPDKIQQKAIDKGIISAQTPLERSACLDLIFTPGFSTADQVSSVSGRGVGMDVVRQNIQGLGGRVSIESEKEKGTRFTLSLPLTLAVLEGMLVRVNEAFYIVPITNILECLRISESHLKSVVTENDMLMVRDESVPLVDLNMLLHGESTDTLFGKLVVIVEEENRNKVGFIVDALLGQRQVVVKSLGNVFGEITGCSSATIMGDGSVALILDINEIVAQAKAKQLIREV